MAAKTHRLSIIGAAIVCFVTAQLNVTLFASEDPALSTDAFASSLPTTSTSETQISTSGELAAAISVDEHAAGTNLVSTASPQIPGIRLPIGADILAASPAMRAAQFKWSVDPTSSSALAGQIYQGRPYRMSRNGSIAALMIGAAAVITGAAILVYANRPDCTTDQLAGGCGYGTKVIGGAVLAGGVVGLFVGALTWR